MEKCDYRIVIRARPGVWSVNDTSTYVHECSPEQAAIEGAAVLAVSNLCGFEGTTETWDVDVWLCPKELYAETQQPVEAEYLGHYRVILTLQITGEARCINLPCEKCP